MALSIAVSCYNGQHCTALRHNVYLLPFSGNKMKDILLKIFNWLRVMIKNRDSLEAAWELIHPHLEDNLKAEWLNIVDLALKELTEEAMAALDEAEENIMSV